MGKGVRKHFAVLDTILQQFIVYDIISIANLSSFHHIIQLTNIFYGPRRFWEECLLLATGLEYSNL